MDSGFAKRQFDQASLHTEFLASEQLTSVDDTDSPARGTVAFDPDDSRNATLFPGRRAPWSSQPANGTNHQCGGERSQRQPEWDVTSAAD